MTTTRTPVQQNIPAELQTLSQWIVWKFETKPGDPKPTKVLYNPNALDARADSTEPRTWGSFDQACAAFARGHYDGIGFVVTEHDPYVGIDLDHCVDDNGDLSQNADRWVRQFNSYTEITPSLKAVRVWIKGTKPGTRCVNKKLDVEVYESARFFTVTGSRMAELPATIEDRQNELEAFYSEVFPLPAQQSNNSQSAPSATVLSMADQELIARMCRKPGIQALWDGDLSFHNNDHSGADQALCNELAYFTNKDAARMDALFKQSGLYRPKWDRTDYKDNTINRAIADTHGTYDPANYRSNGTIPGNPASVVGNPTTFTNGAAGGHSAHSGQGTTTPPPQAKPANYLLTLPTDDEGVAECVDLRYEGRFLHTESHGWLQYTGTHFKAEGSDAAIERAITETLNARIQAALVGGAQNHSELIKKSARNSRGVKAAKNQLQSKVHADISEFDADPDLLNCANGVVDLRTGQLYPHNVKQRFMYCVPVSYNPNADYVEWVEWLTTATSIEAAGWLQTAVGYSLTGYTREEVLFYLYGPPRSGKGTFTDAIMKALGDPVAQAVQFSTFTATREADTQNFDLAPLKPSRFIAASESNTGERFNEAKVKQITGGDKVRCAFKHQNSFEYKPAYKIWLSSNNPVNADPDDDAVWGRVRLINFPNSYLGCEDKALKAKMHSASMLESILCWAVAGAILWYKLGSAGLPELATLAKLKTNQRAELDHVGQWLDECCATDKPDSFLSNEDTHGSYRTWCVENGVTPKQKKGLTQALNKKGFASGMEWITDVITAKKTKKRGFNGLLLKN